ncbi:MAG: peptidoglycan recognition family protein [Oenococcus sp.]|uniref:peptidoglycan recognition protein family protein n=1 Tax=Oenococcus sp. TaxID=1979414 RepID=UPI0039E83B18
MSDQQLKIIRRYMTHNDCFMQGDPLKASGIMIHSTAEPGIMAADWFDLWDRSYAAGQIDRQVAVHAFVDDKVVCQYLPWTMRAWHAGGPANLSFIGIETCEPAGLHYGPDGFQLIGYDPSVFHEYFHKVWQNDIQLSVFLCRQYHIDPGSIISHHEGYLAGLASDHQDPEHWWRYHAKTMDDFRREVKMRLDTGDENGKKEKRKV